MWYISDICTFYRVAGEEYSHSVPCVHYNKEFRNWFGDMVLRLRQLGTSRVVEVRSSGNWGSIDTVLQRYIPYGCLASVIGEDGFMDCTLIAVDAASLKFLEFVDGFTLAHKPSKSRRQKDLNPFWNDLASMSFYPLDDNLTLFGVVTGSTVHGGFPLMHVVMGMENNWREDGNFYLCFKEPHESIYCMNFCNKVKARNLLSKASLMYGESKLRVGIEAMKQVAIW